MKLKGRKKDDAAMSKLIRRQELRRTIEMREEAKLSGLSFREYTETVIRCGV